jgi:hypothetical protein
MVEFRPPRRNSSAVDTMESWIDLNHSVRKLVERDIPVFLTDNAVNQSEEESLFHLMANLGSDADPSAIIPILTSKHPLDYCIRFPMRAAQQGHRSLVVLGGDRSGGARRCVEHAYLLRQMIRRRQPTLVLGGWANPHADPVRQVEFLLAQESTADFYLTQIVSHYDPAPVDAFLEEGARRGLKLPGVFGVFFYRSGRKRTLDLLRPFFPVPARDLGRDLGDGGPGVEEVCARTIATLRARGVAHVYLSNLPPSSACNRIEEVQARAEDLIAQQAT